MYTGKLPPVADKTRDFARELRKKSTDAERRLWARLRNSRMGVKFRRQEPIGRFICDFFCKEAGLIVELDGGQHLAEAQRRRDAKRTSLLNGLGFRVLRFSDRDVIKNLEGVLTAIMEEIGTPPSSPPQAGGE
jgi:very-short-patch-repair endonuclease